MERDDSTERMLSGLGMVKKSEPMKLHTTFGVGGPADLFFAPDTAEHLKDGWNILQKREISCYVVGKGSNLLVSDEGMTGCIISTSELKELSCDRTEIYAGAGVSLAQLSNLALERGLTGLEFASGIPGSVGGAVVMNAGAYGGEIAQVLKEAIILDENGAIQKISADKLELSYRHSCVRQNGWIVLGALFELKTGDPEAIRSAMNTMNRSRREKQPLEYRSAGSTFKRPEGYFAGKLIQDAGLRGYQIGGAQVSEKHCGFVINRGDATAAELKELIAKVQEKVYSEFGIMLEPEVEFLGFSSDRLG